MRFLAPTTLLLLLLGVTTGTLRLWQSHGPELVPAGRYLLMAATLTGLAGIVSLVWTRRLPSREELTEPRIWTAGVLILFISDWISRPYTFFQGPTIRGELLIGALCSYVALRGRWKAVIGWLPIAAAILLFWTFFSVSKGALLIADDHAMFLFRLWLLKENFPSIPFWSPLWNAGFDARDFFATGALNVFLLASPLLYLFDIERVYNLIVALLLWVLTPASTYLATRILQHSRIEAATAATLVVCTGLTWYRWALKYGTMGFLVSAALLPLVIALSVRFISEDRPRRRDLVLLVGVVTLMLLWSLSGVTLLPLVALALPYTTKILRSRRHILTILVVVAINLPWIVMLWKVSHVGRFLNSETTTTVVRQTATTTASPTNHATKLDLPQGTTFRHKKGELSVRRSLDAWQESSGALNPLILIFAIPAIISMRGIHRRVFGSTVAWLFLLGTVGVSLKPQLELDRMIVMAAVLLCIPIARYIVDLLHAAPMGRSYAIAASITGGFLLIGPFSVSSILNNRSYDQYRFAEPSVKELADAIKHHARGGRSLFTGCVMHELSGGHLAPLALWSETPLVASSYAHNIWRYEQPIPKSYLTRNHEGMQEFFDHMNATIILAHEREILKELTAHPELYTMRWHQGRFTLFERIGYTSSYVLAGEIAALSQDHNSVTVTPLSATTVLKFRYFPFLTTDEPRCVIRPYPVAPELDLIELSNCPRGSQVTLHSVTPLERLLHEDPKR